MMATETTTPKSKRTPKAKTTGRSTAGKPTPRPTQADLDVTKAANVLNMLTTASPKLDKVGKRLETALKAIVDGGDSANLPDLEKQVTEFLTNGVPAVMKSTRRRTAAEQAKVDEAAAGTAAAAKAVLSDADKRGIADDAKALSGLKGGKVKTAVKDEKARRTEMEGELREVARTTGAKRVSQIEQEKREAAKGPGHLAKGVDARNSPQSVAAHQSRKAAAKPDPAPMAAKAAQQKAARQAERASKAAPKADDARSITILKKDFAFGKEGTSRRASWDKALKAKTVKAYIASGGAAKYLPRWVSAGAIKLG